MQIATEFLNALSNECAETLTRLQAFIHEARERYEHEHGWHTDNPHLEAQSDYPLYIPALSTEQSMMQYYDRVSIFTSRRAQPRFLEDNSQTLDPSGNLPPRVGARGPRSSISLMDATTSSSI